MHERSNLQKGTAPRQIYRESGNPNGLAGREVSLSNFVNSTKSDRMEIW